MIWKIYLPILIGIIWVAYTLYNKGKKKKEIKHACCIRKKERQTPFIFEQILMGEEIKVPQPYTEYSEPEEPRLFQEKQQKEYSTREKITQVHF